MVEAYHPDIRVLIRNLTIANALSRVTGARSVALVGADPEWEETFWRAFDRERVKALVSAYGIHEIVDVHDVVAQRLAEGDLGDVPLSEAEIDARADSTVCRLRLVPRLPAEDLADPVYLGRRRRVHAFASVYASILDRYTPKALVTCDVEYDQWGVLVDLAVGREIPVVHVQTTGSLKAYTLFPEARSGEATFRAEMTRLIAGTYEGLRPHAHLLERSAERVFDRSRNNLGRPSWWRKGSASTLELTTADETSQFRGFVRDRLGLDKDQPVIAVFSHALSDALGTNRESFADLAEWLEETAHFARGRPDAYWLFLDHPHQASFDRTGFFARLAETFAEAPNLRFMRSLDLSRNSLYAIADLGVTVRGSVANELPALGIPVLQAGWSEWSDCGFSQVVTEPSAYWKALDTAIGTLAAGGELITAEQISAARLWQWLYRSGADVVSPLVPHWEVMPAGLLLSMLGVSMSEVESDGDPVFTAVARMWTKREPMLTRFDLTDATEIQRNVR
ncbi:hypothetical protein OIE66_35575 [Nonomuraea sp. NBC_01738]|uniref:hypothetical protein n=1 Tax=Nonomuraea sp. NBC_01738 TaxID=2976003 RepID=UPI002E10BFD7|nr:hypothetical protein OIE66_35575 [Nonomuraea sp. NBC_01738]